MKQFFFSKGLINSVSSLHSIGISLDRYNLLSEYAINIYFHLPYPVTDPSFTDSKIEGNKNGYHCFYPSAVRSGYQFNYRAFGRGVPQEISDLDPIKKMCLDLKAGMLSKVIYELVSGDSFSWDFIYQNKDIVVGVVAKVKTNGTWKISEKFKYTYVY